MERRKRAKTKKFRATGYVKSLAQRRKGSILDGYRDHGDETRDKPKELNFYRLQGISILLFTNFFCVIFIEDETRFRVFKLAY